MKTVIQNGQVFYQGKIQSLDVEITDKKISAVGKHLEGEHTIDAKGLLVIPD